MDGGSSKLAYTLVFEETQSIIFTLKCPALRVKDDSHDRALTIERQLLI